jgi:hypothetical protein
MRGNGEKVIFISVYFFELLICESELTILLCDRSSLDLYLVLESTIKVEDLECESDLRESLIDDTYL